MEAGAVARVAVDVSLAHLDRPFDYLVPESLDAVALPGARVRVRFAGRLRDGFILQRRPAAATDRPLASLERVVSDEVVLTPVIAALVRSVADHYAGTFADVVRLAVPPRHGITEKAAPPDHPVPADGGPSHTIGHYPDGAGLLAAIAEGRGRAALTLAPVADPLGDWVGAITDLASSASSAGRGALLLVPDQRDLARLADACTARFGAGSFVTLTAESGPAARYRAFLAAARGDVRLVLGTRAAVFAPVQNLGLIALFDDGDDSWAEPRAPYPHAREVAALRSSAERCGLVYVGYSRTAEVQALVDRGWLVSLQAPSARRREVCPVVRVAADSDRALERDPGAGSRLPREVFEAVRAALPTGSVLIHVPRAGYLAALACQNCRTTARCPTCQQPLIGDRGEGGTRASCRWCGAVESWRCSECGGQRWRAPRVGVQRTAEELGRAFPQTPVVYSAADKRVDRVELDGAIVVATPGSEPLVPAGYAAAVLLDAELSLNRADLRAGEESLRRWLAVTSLVRPAAVGGTVVVVGDPSARAIQALVRHDAVGFAERELADRAESGFPPAAKVVTIEGSAAAVGEAAAVLRGTAADALGPVAVTEPGKPDESMVRLTLRVPSSQGRSLVAAAKELQEARSAAKASGALRIRVDPQVL